MDKNIGEYLYNNKLPGVYRREDTKSLNKLPLKRFLQVLDCGFNEVLRYIKAQEDLYDIDKCPVEFLSFIVETIGFVFPFALSENEQRKFTKALPKLYKAKGTPRAFEYLAREIFGTGSSAKAYKETYKPGMTPSQWRKIYIQVTTNKEQFNLDKKEEYFKKFCELIRPVNTLLITVIVSYFQDAYDKNRLGDDKDSCFIEDDNRNEVYRKIRMSGSKYLDDDFYLELNESIMDFKEEYIEDTIKDTHIIDLLSSKSEDVYEKSPICYSEDFIMLNPILEEYDGVSYSCTDVLKEIFEETRTNNTQYDACTSIVRVHTSTTDSDICLDGKFYTDDIHEAVALAY